MRQLARVALGLLIGFTLLGAPGEAADGTPGDAKNEIVVLGGASVIDVDDGEVRMMGMPGWGGDRWPDFPDVQVRTESSLGGSALFGARYSRYVKGRLAVEADLVVAPSHEVEQGGEVCILNDCFGPDGGGRMHGGWGMGPAPDNVGFDWPRGRNLTAWHYGAGLACDLTGGDVRPFVVFGAGGVSYSGAGNTSTDFDLRFGAGLKVLFGRVGARVDVVDHLVTDHFLSGDAEHDVHATAGFLVRF